MTARKTNKILKVQPLFNAEKSHGERYLARRNSTTAGRNDRARSEGRERQVKDGKEIQMQEKMREEAESYENVTNVNMIVTEDHQRWSSKKVISWRLLEE